MFEKVLVAEDLGSINQGILNVLTALTIPEVIQSQYCDDAFLKIKRASLDQCPFELLITDLSFKKDHRKEHINSGEELIKCVKKEFPDLPIIVYSIEDRLQKVRSLLLNDKINAYVCKGRLGLKELTEAIRAVTNGKVYISPQVNNALKPQTNLEIDEFDIELMKHLAKGMSQDQISSCFKQKNISPNSLSSIEKRLNKLRIQFKANNVTHLISVVKDMGII